jgi:hypothetical protein
LAARKNNAFPEEKITIDLNNVTLHLIFKEVRRKTGRQYIAEQNVISLSKRINIHLTDVSIKQLLDYIMQQFPVKCALVGQIITVALKTFSYERISCLVVDSSRKPVPGAIILVKGIHEPHTCDKNGITNIYNVTGLDTLVVYAEKLNNLEIPVESDKMTIVLKGRSGTLAPYQLNYKNGIKEEPAATASGSFVIPDMDLYHNRNQDPNIIMRLRWISIPFPTNQGNLDGATAYSFRGRTSFAVNRNALTVFNGHAQAVSTDNFNPIDIDTIYLGRDAEALALWGAVSGSTAWIFEPKKGISSGRKFNLYSSCRFTDRPNLHYQQGLTAAMQIELEKKAFEADAPMAWSPVTDLLTKVKNGSIDSALATAILQKWGANDLKSDLIKAAYQPALLQQYGLSFQTGTPKIQVYTSIGIDDQKPVEKGDRFTRFTTVLNVTYQNAGWEAQAMVNMAYIRNRQNAVKMRSNLPYLSLWTENGDAATLPVPNTNTDSNFLPADYVYNHETALADHISRQFYQSYTVKAGYQFRFGLKATVNYQFSHTNYNDGEQHPLASFFTRSLINKFRQNNNGNISWPVPVGDIADKVTMESFIHSLRGQLDFKKKINQFTLSALAGVERRSYDMNGHAIRNYATNVSVYPTPVDYSTLFELSTAPGQYSRVPNINSPLDSANHLFGYYSGSTVSYQDKYSFSLSMREDFMNRFSASRNGKGIGLWAAGASWHISNESFYHGKDIFSDLKLRFTVGQNGNVDFSIPPYHSIQSATTQGTVYNYAVANTQQIGYEKLLMINAGIDFRTAFLWGSIDVYHKKGWDLLQDMAWNPTAGTNVAKGNSGALKGGGLDLDLQSKRFSIANELKYSTTLLLAYTTNKVTSDGGIKRPAQDYTNPDSYIPRKGYPAEAIYAFPYGGLNEEGAPRGYLDGSLSEQYFSILSATDGSTLNYVGSATPVMVANSTHSLHYRSFTLSWLFTLRTGYYVRTPPLNYFKLLQRTGGDAPGYNDRWQNKDAKTDIPALSFPIDIGAMQFYEGSRANVIKGDHIRWQDIQLGYQWENTHRPRFPFKKLEAYLTVANLGIIWRANNKGIDPDIPAGGHPTPRSTALTLNLTF